MPFKRDPKTLLAEAELWTLYGFLFTLPFSKALANVFIVSTAVLWALECIFERRVLFPKTPLNLLIAAFLLSIFLSFLETSSVALSIRGVEKVIQRLGLFFLAAHVLRTPERQGRFFRLIAVGFALVLVSGAVQYFSGLDFLRHRPIRYANQLPRITSCFEFADQYAVYLIYMVFVYGFLVWDRNVTLPGRIGSAALMLAGVASLFFTHARSGWIGFIAALACSVFFMKRVWLILAGLMTVLVFLLLASPSDVLIHKDSHGREQSLAERWTLWNRALEIVKHHPLTGIGINTYAVSGDRYMKDEKQNLAHYYAHNSYLQMAAESGLISIALFLAIPALFLFRTVRVIRSGDLPSAAACFLKAAFSGTVGFLVLNYFESALFSVQPSQLFYFFLGTGAALLKPSTEDRR